MQDKDTPQPATIDDLVRQLRQNQSDNLDGYLQTYLKATGLGVEDVALVQQTVIENNVAGNRYWFEKKPCAAGLRPAHAARTDQEIVDQTNELASKLAGLDGWILDGNFYSHPDPRAIGYWNMACAAQENLTDTDPNDALINLGMK